MGDLKNSARGAWVMRDADVRAAVRQMLTEQHAGDDDTKIVEEMGIWSGSVRIDVAVINGRLTGYELKSDRDTLDRLPAQAELYSRVFDEVCLVVGARHAGKARRIVPRWWGVMVATVRKGEVRLQLVREGKPNPAPDPLLVARLLWRSEALAILEARGMAKGWRSKSAPQVHAHLASVLSQAELSDAVRAALKARQGWLGESVSDQGHVPVGTDFHPGLAVPWSACGAGNMLDAREVSLEEEGDAGWDLSPNVLCDALPASTCKSVPRLRQGFS
jgi:hypothetical protein